MGLPFNVPLGPAYVRPRSGYNYPYWWFKKRQPPHIESHVIYTVSVTDNVVISDTVTGRNSTNHETVTDSVVITDSISFVAANFQTVTDSVVITDSITSHIAYPASVTDSVTITDSISFTYTNLQTVTHSVIVTDAISFTYTNIQHLTDSVVITDVIARLGTVYNISVVQEVSISGIGFGATYITEHAIYHRSITDNVVITDVVAELATAVGNDVIITDSISFNRVINKHVIDNVIITDLPYIQSPLRLSVLDYVTIIEGIQFLAPTRISVIDTVVIGEFITGREGTNRQTVTDSVILADVIRRLDAVYNITVTDSVVITQRINTIYNLSLEQEVEIALIVGHTRYVTRNLIQTEVLTSDFSYLKEYHYTFLDNLVLISNLTRNIIVTRSFDQQQNLNSKFGAVLIFGMTPHPVVTSIPTINPNITILSSNNSTIILPTPEWGDTSHSNDKVNVQRTMTGNTYAYVKKSQTRILNYMFILDLPKALELKAWLLANQNNQIGLSNWKGEIWDMQLITNLIEFNNVGRAAGNAREKVSVSLAFEGVKVAG